MENNKYLVKVEFKEYIGYKHRSSLFLNLVEKELSYQVYNYKKQMPTAEGIITEENNGEKLSYRIRFPARVIKNAQTEFKPIILKTDYFEQEVVFSYGVNLSDDQMRNLLPYCKVEDFEAFRNCKMSMDDEGVIGYRVQCDVRFKATTDSPIPIIELPMYLFYDKDHIWPNEKLYRYIEKNFLKKNREVKNWMTHYGW